MRKGVSAVLAKIFVPVACAAVFAGTAYCVVNGLKKASVLFKPVK